MLNTRTKLQKPVRVGLIGAGKFGSMILSQARHIEGLIISAVADLDVEKTKESFNRVGWDTSNCFAWDLSAPDPDYAVPGGFFKLVSAM